MRQGFVSAMFLFLLLASPVSPLSGVSELVFDNTTDVTWTLHFEVTSDYAATLVGLTTERRRIAEIADVDDMKRDIGFVRTPRAFAFKIEPGQKVRWRGISQGMFRGAFIKVEIHNHADKRVSAASAQRIEELSHCRTLPGATYCSVSITKLLE